MANLTAVKNIRPYAVDVGGRMLAPGEGPVDLDVEDAAVAEQVELGHVVVCVQPPARPVSVLVGEAGPELVPLPDTARVTPAPEES